MWMVLLVQNRSAFRPNLSYDLERDEAGEMDVEHVERLLPFKASSKNILLVQTFTVIHLFMRSGDRKEKTPPTRERLAILSISETQVIKISDLSRPT